MRNIFFTFLIIVLLNSILDAQNKYDQSKIDSLNQVIFSLVESKNNLGIINELLTILQIDPENLQAQNQLVSMIRAYYAQVSEEVLNKSLNIIKEKNKLPIIQLFVHYYTTNDIKKIQELIFFIVGNNKLDFKINPEPLYAVNHKFNPKIFNDILISIGPHIVHDKVSDYIFLNYLYEPNQKLIDLVQKLNIKLEDLKLCTDSLDLARIRKNYFDKNPNPVESQFSFIKNNLADCFKLQDPLWRLLYYYQRNEVDLVKRIILERQTIKKKYQVDIKMLSNLDFTLNPVLAKQIAKHIFSFCDSTLKNEEVLSEMEQLKLNTLFYFCDVTNPLIKFKQDLTLQPRLINFYKHKLFHYVDYILENNVADSTAYKFELEELKNFYVSLDTVYAKKIITAISTNLTPKSLNEFDDEMIYEFNKLCYSLNIFEMKFNLELIDRINPNEADFSKMVMWGISCILENDDERARRLFNNIENFGDRNSIDYLDSELEWWQQIGLNSQLISERKTNHNSKYSGLLTTYQPKQENNFIDINNVTEKNYYAVLIGVENYIQKDMNLKFPLRDLKSLKEVLISDYIFDHNNVITLSDPKRVELYEAFKSLRKKLTADDNLLVFYAGHGYWDIDLEQGYWLPSDALSNDKSNWISNSEIIDLLKAIKCKHTLLIADACFSGSIFMTRKAFHEIDKSVELAYSNKSRNGITSGANSPVPDKSIFVEMFIKNLKQNKEKYLMAEQLYLDFRDVVTNNSQIGQRPLFGELEGDEGGEFIFIRK